MSDDFNFEQPKPEDKEREISKRVSDVHSLLVTRSVCDLDCKALYNALPDSVTKGSYNETFDLSEELGCQLSLVRGLRKEIFHPDGTLKDEYGIDAAKQVLTASRDLSKILQTSHGELVNYRRIQAIETAFLDTIADMPQKTQEKYANLLEIYLEQSSPA